MKQIKFTKKGAEATLLAKRLIKKRRNQLKMSVAALARKMGIPHKKMEDIETERDYGCFLYADDLKKLAAALEVGVGYFFDDHNLEN
jgi:transcriptional regulator with XRE-family HTH domain